MMKLLLTGVSLFFSWMMMSSEHQINRLTQQAQALKFTEQNTTSEKLRLDMKLIYEKSLPDDICPYEGEPEVQYKAPQLPPRPRSNKFSRAPFRVLKKN
jgi:hypothetical protein